MLTKLNPRHREGGFTLIELLIVVAIIGILAALAIPSYINYLKKTRTNECVTALGSIRDLQTAYLDDEFMGGGTTYASNFTILHWSMKGGATQGKYFNYTTTQALARCTAQNTDNVSHKTVELNYRAPTDSTATDKLVFKTN